MEFGKTLKDVILITPWIISLVLFMFVTSFIYLFLLFGYSLIFIYDKTGEIICQLKK